MALAGVGLLKGTWVWKHSGLLIALNQKPEYKQDPEQNE
jgi:hypothetical protein